MTPTPSPTEVAETAAAALDPTLIVLLPIIGVIATVIGGFIGAWFQGRREHAKWLRERRLEAYTRALSTASALRGLTIKLEEAKAAIAAETDPAKQAAIAAELDPVLVQISRIDEELSERLAPLVILGPQDVGDAYSSVIDALEEHGPRHEEVDKAETALQTKVRKALGIKA